MLFRSFGYGINAKDHYVTEPTKTRVDYQLDPGVVFTNPNETTANDFISYINRVNWVTNYSTLMKINLPITMTDYVNMNADKAAGWGFQIKLTVPQGTEYCSIPL